MADGHPARRVVDILTGAWQAQALYAAAALDLPDHVADGHTTAAQLAGATGADQDGIERLMRLLTAMGVFTDSGTDPGTAAPDAGYRLTEVGDLLRTGHERSMRDMAVFYGEEFHRAWGAVVLAIRTGTSGFEHAFGTSLHAYLETQPGAGARFQRAMNAGNAFFPDVAERYDFAACRTVVDVAGGSGRLLSTVLRAHPHLHGVLFDLPRVTPVAAEHLGRAVRPGRWETRAGDAFEAVPPGADAYLLSRVLQDWDDARCARLLANLRTAMPDSGRLLIVERVIPTTHGPGSADGPSPSDGPGLLAVLWDLHLLMAAGGRERTLDGYRTLLDGAGLRLESVTPLALETSLLVAAPAEPKEA
ncbi:methyltransferase [Streptomyces noursei]|uniref:methyltransferase n=1 Tax=Streptomyces noursei TaxID=1971 RepID=UPI0016782EC4|nr:methyltransferase [Streptomyces noursei]MCZ1018727.1 methyltransferase [Streptomyces noursei]GGX26848.1 phenazine-specific methyltransferase [Streptomyces noursei]